MDLPTPPEWDRLLSASQKNNADEISRLVEEGVPPTHANVVGQTALHIASLWGSVEALQVLIEKGADPNAQNRIAGMTPLHCAIRGTFQSFHETHRNRLQCIKLLLDAGADPTICDKRDTDAEGCIDDLVKEAKTRGLGELDVEAEEIRAALVADKSILVKSVEDRDVDRVRACLDGELETNDCCKALICALDSVQSISDQSSADDTSFEPVVEIIQSLLEAGDKLDDSIKLQSTKDKCLETICSIANDSEKLQPPLLTITKDLIAHNAALSNNIQMLLPDCARKGRLEMVKFLIDTVGIDPNFAGRQNMTALHFASRGGNVGIVKLMLDSCPSIDVNALDRAGKKAVDYAIANEKDEIVSLLSEC